MTNLTLRLGSEFTLDLAGDRWRKQGARFTIAASSGGGKSNLAAVFAEEINSYRIPFAIIDPRGEYRSLCSLPNVVVCGRKDDDDIPFAFPNQKWIEQSINQLDQRNSVILDLSINPKDENYTEDEQLVAYTQFLKALYYHQWEKRDAGVPDSMFLFIEEAHNFAPQKRAKDQDALRITITISREGRKEGINTVIISQRPGDMEKDILNQSNARFTGYLEGERDFEAVKSLFPKGFTHKDFLTLGTGTFYFTVAGNVYKTKIRRRHTEDLAETPAIKAYQPALMQVAVQQ